MSTLAKITGMLYELDHKELRELNKRVANTIDQKAKEIQKEMARKLEEGDTVETFGLRKDNGQQGTVKKINRTRAVVEFPKGRYNVPLQCLKKVS